MAKLLKIENFRASDGWLWRFRNRHGLCQRHFRSTAISSNTRRVPDLCERLDGNSQSSASLGDSPDAKPSTSTSLAAAVSAQANSEGFQSSAVSESMLSSSPTNMIITSVSSEAEVEPKEATDTAGSGHNFDDCTSEEDNSSTQEHQPGMSGPYLLKKETHCTTILDQLMRDDTFTDVTLTAEGQNIRAHRMVLCLASNYFRQVLSKDSHIQSVVVLRDVKFSELKSIINFIYTGEATVDACELQSFMRTAETLEITSLCESCRSPGGPFSSLIGASLSSAVEEAKTKGGKRPWKDDFCRPSKSSRTSDGLYYSQVSVDDPNLTIVKEEIPESDEVDVHASDASDVGGKSHVPVEKSADPHGSLTDGCVSSGQDSSHNVTVVPIVALQGQIMGGCSPLKTEPGHPVSEMKHHHVTESAQATTSGSDAKHSNEDTGEIPSIPGRCPYCPHLSQSFEGYPMMQHLLLTHPCKPAFPCNLCWRVFVKRTMFKLHREQCCTESKKFSQ